MICKQALSALALFGLLASTSTRADETAGFYAGAGIGHAMNESGEFKDSGAGYKIVGGYAFNSYFAADVQLIYVDTLQHTIDDVHVAIENHGLVVAALGRWPLGESFSLFGKLGYTFYEQKATARWGTLSYREKDRDDDPLYGAGVELSVGKNFQLRAEYEVVDVADADFNLTSISGVFRF